MLPNFHVCVEFLRSNELRRTSLSRAGRFPFSRVSKITIFVDNNTSSYLTTLYHSYIPYHPSVSTSPSHCSLLPHSPPTQFATNRKNQLIERSMAKLHYTNDSSSSSPSIAPSESATRRSKDLLLHVSQLRRRRNRELLLQIDQDRRLQKTVTVSSSFEEGRGTNHSYRRNTFLCSALSLSDLPKNGTIEEEGEEEDTDASANGDEEADSRSLLSSDEDCSSFDAS